MLSDQDLVECVEKIKDRLDAIPTTAPTIPDHIWKNLKELTPK